MKAVSVTCDACAQAVGWPCLEHYVLSYGIAGCVTRSADLCKSCAEKFEAALGIKWGELPEETER